RLANLRRPRLLVRDLSRRDFLCRHQLRKSALRGGNEHSRLSQAARPDDRSGAAAQVQAGQHGYFAALYRAAAAVSADPLAAAASADSGARRLRAALRAHLALQLELAELSERALVLQPVCLATVVRVRGVVRARGCPAAC